jgi:hypothetical protein
MHTLKNKIKIRYLSFLTFFFLSTLPVFGLGYTHFWFIYNGNHYQGGFQSSEVENTPSWNPQKDDSVPLSIQNAIEIGRENLKPYIPNADEKWSVKRVDLNHVYGDKWFYSIHFYCLQPECAANARYFPVRLIMDGTFIEPNRITPTNLVMQLEVFSKEDFTFNFGTNVYRTKATTDDLKETPSWNPEKENTPPLSIQKALEIALDKINQSEQAASIKLNLDSIIFKNVGDDKWVYIIDFICTEELKTCGGRYFRVYVKMDGTIIEPAITPKT